MDALSNIAGTAHKAVFGTGITGSGSEPVAGAQGPGTADAPYDKGNEEAEQNNEPSNAQSKETTGDPSSGQEGVYGGDKNQGANAPHQDPDEDDAELGSKGKDGKPRMPHTDDERERLMEKGNFPRDPNDHSGEPLHMHRETGDAEAGNDDKPKDRKDSVAQEGGDPHGTPKGDGTQYVKSTGVAADGGDFDATKPGAGAEANRLLEEKGVHKSEGNKGPPAEDNSNTGGADTAPKESKLQKIKDKLHLS